MKHTPSAPPEEAKLNPFSIFSDIYDNNDILHIFTDGKCKLPATSNVTKVQLPQGNNRNPIDINVCNKIQIEPPKRIKVLIQINLTLWLMTMSIFSVALAMLYMETQTHKHNIQELSQTILSMSSKYEYLRDIVEQSSSVRDFPASESVSSAQTKDYTDRNKAIVNEHINTDKIELPDVVMRTVNVQKDIEREYEDYDSIDDKSTNHTDGYISYRRNRRRNTKSAEGPVVIQFKGALPYIDITNEGRLIGPWVTDDVGSGVYNLTEFYITERGNAIEIVQSGLYIIYAQVFYETTSLSNSFSINIRRQGHAKPSPIAFCSTTAQNTSEIYKSVARDISCYTSVVRYLSRHDRLLLQQQEINRRVVMRDGYSFIGLVRLNSEINTINTSDRNNRHRT